MYRSMHRTVHRPMHRPMHGLMRRSPFAAPVFCGHFLKPGYYCAWSV